MFWEYDCFAIYFCVVLGLDGAEELMVLVEPGTFEMVEVIDSNDLSEFADDEHGLCADWLHGVESEVEQASLVDAEQVGSGDDVLFQSQYFDVIEI